MKITDNFLKRIQNIHFIGIGGIGISAIARMMLMQGKKISGSDKDKSIITKELKNLGAKIYKSHSDLNLVWDTDLVVYTTAISDNNPELKRARKLTIPILSYPEILGVVSKNKFTIAVSGSHGKTTTTAMIGKILLDMKLDPTIILGSLLKDLKTNLVVGKSKYFVCEACEYKKAFLNLNPKIIIITNIDNDHLDYYKNLTNIQNAFSQFAARLGKRDFLVYNSKDKNSTSVVKRVNCRKVDYSKIMLPKNFKLKIAGNHNLENAQAALAVAKILKINPLTALGALKGFSGTWRRFDYKGKTKKGALVYDDYAHHPTEIQATLGAFREKFANRKIWCVFQPHLFSRTKLLMNDFAKSFNDADYLIITDIYAARERNVYKINSGDLIKKTKNYHSDAIYIKSFSQIEKVLKKNMRPGDVLITMGAGDIFKIGENLLR
ncbi:MAG: Mur ligase domain-containing protein [Patescibacteria group bacterium]